MAFVDKSYKKTDQDGSATPLGMGQQGGAAPDQATAGQADPNVPVSAPNMEAGKQSKPQATNKKGPASSGMFTNIQNYVNKNKEHAKKMSDSSLDKIRESSDRLKDEKKQALSQFTDRTTQDGMTNTQERLDEFNQYVNTEANQDFAQPAQEATTESTIPAPVNEITSSGVEIPVRNDEGVTTGYRDSETGIIRDVDPNAPDRTMAPRDAVQQKNNFERIINAQYGGPKTLVEAGDIYGRLADQARTTSNLGGLAQTSEGRGNLLKELFNKEGYGYTRGQNELDKLLMGNQVDTVKEMQRAGQDIGSYDSILNQAGSEANQIAGIASGKVDDLRNASRESFGNIAAERQNQVDTRVGAVVENWDKLPDHFRKKFSNPDGTVNLSAVEASMIGVRSGEGFYNKTGDELFAREGQEGYVDPVTGKLISNKESANLNRLNALSNLANTDSKLYNINDSDYKDPTLAGTQNAYDALNTGHLRDTLAGAEREFRDFANENVRGHGQAEDNYWDASGTQEYWENATINLDGTLADSLGDSYDFDSDIIDENIANEDIVTDFAEQSNYGTNGNTGSGSYEQGDGTLRTIDDFGKNLTNPIGAIHDWANQIDIPGVSDIISGITGVLGGGRRAAAQREAQKQAIAIAKRDYTDKMKNKFEDSNVNNRIGVADNAETQANQDALQELMRQLDLTNI